MIALSMPWRTKSGRLRWQHQFAAPAQYPATIANDVLYITTGDGVYALRSEDGVGPLAPAAGE